MASPFPLILLVDDDPDILRALELHLEADGYRVAKATSAAEAMARLAGELPALAVVDVMLPDRDGFDVARRIKRQADIPVIILSVVDSEERVVRALQEFADDYVVKPFRHSELEARIARVLRRVWQGEPPAGSTVVVDDRLTIDFAVPEVRTPRGSERLSPLESRLLHLLVHNAGRILPSELLLDRLWPEGDGEMGYLWEYVRRLREKIGDDAASPRYLFSERGVGYRFQFPGQDRRG